MSHILSFWHIYPSTNRYSIPEFGIITIPNPKAGVVESVYSLLIKFLQKGESVFYSIKEESMNISSLVSMPTQSLFPQGKKEPYRVYEFWEDLSLQS